MTKEETAKILLAITGVFSNFRPNEMTLPTWFRLLGAIQMQDVINSLDSYIATGAEFAPTPGQLIQLMQRKSLPQAEKITADEAWLMVENVAAASCKPQSMAFLQRECPRAMASASQIGWNRIRYSDLEKEMSFVRRDFIQAYERTIERDALERQALTAPEQVVSIVNGLANQKGISQ